MNFVGGRVVEGGREGASNCLLRLLTQRRAAKMLVQYANVAICS